jgi:hypothetical protein
MVVPAVSAEKHYKHSEAEAYGVFLGQQQKLGQKVWEAFARGCLLFWKKSDNLNSFCKKRNSQ